MFSSSKISDHFIWEHNKKTLKPTFDYEKRKPRQLIKEKFHENGSFYIFNKEKFKINKRRFFGKIGTFAQKKYKSFQLDDMEDAFIIDSIFKNIKKLKYYEK